jgi:hypothetical protein
MLDVVDVERVRSGAEVRVGGFDLIWNNGPLGPDTHSCLGVPPRAHAWREVPGATGAAARAGCFNPKSKKHSDKDDKEAPAAKKRAARAKGRR